MLPKIQIIGDVNKVSKYIPWAKRQWKLREGRWSKHAGECLIEFFRNGDMGFIRLISEASRGFITHPRSGTPRQFQFPGTDSNHIPTLGTAHTGKGYSESAGGLVDEGDFTGVQEGQPYPLIDEDTTAKHWLFEKTEEEWDADGPQELMYGNIDWKGPVIDSTDDRLIISYKGNPSRYWPVNQFVEIPGLSSIDHTIESSSGDYSFTTVFGPFVYQGGEVLAEMPKLYAPLNSGIQPAQVLGAALRQADEVLVCAVKTCYNSYPRAKAVDELVSTWQVWLNGLLVTDWLEDEDSARKEAASIGGLVVEVPDPGRGYFVEIIVQRSGDISGGWKRLLRIPFGTNMPNSGFFFSADGAKCSAVLFDKIYTVSIGTDTATYAETDTGTFTHTITTSVTSEDESTPWGEGEDRPLAGSWKQRSKKTRTYTQVKSGQKIIAVDYKGNELVTMTASLSGGNVYTKVKDFGTKWGETARIPSLTEASDRVPYLSLGYCDGGGGPGTVSFVATAGGSCDPAITINGIPVNSGECTVFEIPECTEDIVLYPVTATLIDNVTGLTDTFTGEAQIATGATWTYVAGSGTCGDVGFCSYYPSGQPYNCLISAAIQTPPVTVPIPDDYTTEYLSDTLRKRREVATWMSTLTNSGLCTAGTYDFRSRWTDYVIVGTLDYPSCTETVYYGYLASCWWEEELICP